METVDLLIKNGRVIDPERGVDGRENIACIGRRIAPWTDGMEARTVIDAEGCIVVPGLIDYHAHVFERGTDSGINPDLAMLPLGVTTVVDAGSSGVSTYRSFMDRLDDCRIKSRLFLHVSPTGQVTHQYPETILPEKWNMEKFRDAFETYPDKILGLKIRISRNVFGDRGMCYLEKAIELAQQFDKRLVVHVTDPPVPQSQVASVLRPGDVFCHVFNGRGHTILENGCIPDAIWNARARGVIFDACHGSINFNFGVAEKAIAEGFLPDVLSSDMNSVTWCRPPLFSLLIVMSKFLLMGMPLRDVIASVTSTPASLIGEKGNLGTLACGSCADIAILKLEDRTIRLVDAEGNTRMSRQVLRNVATVLDGTLVYRAQELCF